MRLSGAVSTIAAPSQTGRVEVRSASEPCRGPYLAIGCHGYPLIRNQSILLASPAEFEGVMAAETLGNASTGTYLFMLLLGIF